jgi:hypothetical protein
MQRADLVDCGGAVGNVTERSSRQLLRSLSQLELVALVPSWSPVGPLSAPCLSHVYPLW